MFADYVAVISPCIFEVHYEHVAGLYASGCLHDGGFADDWLHIKSTLDQNHSKYLIGDFTLNQISSIEAVKTISPEYSLLLADNLPIAHILTIVAKIVIDWCYFFYEIVRSFKFLTFAGKVEIIKFIPDIREVDLFD